MYCSVGRQRCQLLREIKHEETVSILSGGPSAEEVFRIPNTCNIRRYRTLYLMYHLLPRGGASTNAALHEFQAQTLT